jgi:hypothetical protein
MKMLDMNLCNYKHYMLDMNILRESLLDYPYIELLLTPFPSIDGFCVVYRVTSQASGASVPHNIHLSGTAIMCLLFIVRSIAQI